MSLNKACDFSLKILFIFVLQVAHIKKILFFPEHFHVQY